MTEPTERPRWETGSLWGVLAVFLVVGSVGAATFVYGLTWLFVGDWLGILVAGFGAVVAFLAGESASYLTGQSIVVDGGNIIQEHKGREADDR